MHKRLNAVVCSLVALACTGSIVAHSQQTEALTPVPSRIVQTIDNRSLVTLRGNVRRDLQSVPDMGTVQDGEQFRLYLVLKRSPAQEADLKTLLARQQQPTAKEYHKWLTPQEFGARFGASPEDIARITGWLESRGLQVKGVMNNRSMIDFTASAAQVREEFHTPCTISVSRAESTLPTRPIRRYQRRWRVWFPGSKV